MKGWMPDGTEIELMPWQEEVVKMYMDINDRKLYIAMMPTGGRAWGGSVVTATISRLDENKKETGEWFPDSAADPRH